MESYTNSYEVNAKYLQTAVTDGAMFTLPAPTAISDMHPDLQYCTKGYKIYKSGSNREDITVETFSGGNMPAIYPVTRNNSTGDYFYMGPAVASDDAGTLWTHTMRGSDPTTTLDWEVGIHTFCYYTERPALGVPGTKKTINLDPLGKWMVNKAYLISANGDGVNGTGYIWIAAASTKIARYTIEKGVFVAKELFSTPLSGGDSPASNYCYVKQHGNKVYYTTPAYNGTTMTAQAIYRGELSADGKSITWESTPVVTDNYSPQFTVFTLSGHDFLVYNSYDETDSDNPYKEITIYDMTTNTPILLSGVNPRTIYLPSKNNYIRQSLNAEVVDDYHAYIYGYIPGVGVYRYPIVATPDRNPVTNISVECEGNYSYLGRQDAKISWDAPASAQSYIVYYQSSYTNGAGTKVTSDWIKVGETTETSITHDDVCWATVLEDDDRKYYERSYTYKVIPVYESGALGTEAISSALTPEFIPCTPMWVDANPVQDNEGYCIVQLLWKEWHGYGCQPHHYNVIRDDEAINYRNGEILEIGGSNYVDTTCVSGATYRYHIEAVYPNVTVDAQYSNYFENEDKDVTIATRDWAKPRYSISKVYEYKIVGKDYESEEYEGYDGVVRPDTKEFPNFYTEPDCYRQGVFYNGCWYIAQYTNDNTASVFEHDPQLKKTTVKGGILRFLGEDPRMEIPNDPYKYRTTYPKNKVGDEFVDVPVDSLIERRPLVSYHRENQCVAVDESGTFLTRGLRTGWSWNENSWEDNNNYALACSSVEFHNFDNNWHGSFDLPASLVAELEASAVAESMRAEDPTLPGRVDYFSAQGDLYNDDWCYLYMAPMVSKTVFRVKLVKSENTVYVPEGNWIKFTEDKNAEFDYADENYAFPVNCENREGEQFVYEQLTNVYSLYSGTNTDPSQKGKNIYETSTFVNTIGGTTFEFNNELFLVAPQGQYPGNTGSFLVGMANRFEKDENNKWVNVGAANADMTNIIPTAQWYTGKANTDATETNGLWIYGEQAKDADGNIIDENKDGMTDYAYIYTYRPGVMFGKYILTPTTQFPPSQVILSIDPLYETDKETDNGTDILRYDATASWKDVENYATSGGNFYEIKGYTFSLYDVEKRDNGSEGGEIINVTFNMTGLNPDGTITDDNGNIVEGLTYTPYTMVENGVEKTYYEYTYVKEDVDAVDDNCEKRDFIAYVTVNYKGLPGQSTEGLSFNSAQTEYIDANAYVPELPQATTTIYKETYLVPKDTDGDNKPDTDFQFYYFYMDMVEPESEDPVTNYTITVDKGNGEVETLDKFYLYDPEGTTGLTPNKDGYVEITAEYDENGNLITPAAIPGTYDFDAARKAIAEKNNAENTTHQQIIKWQVGDAVDPNNDGDNSPIEGDEAKWKITVNAHYANTNAKISYSTNGGETLYYKDGTLTGVESPLCSSDISVYPNPAESYIIVKSPSVIGKLSIHAADGREMRTIDVDDTSVQINVENLSKGIYVIKVNGITKKFSKK